MKGVREETDEERPYDSFGRNGMELESAGSIKSYGRLDRVPVVVNRDQGSAGFPGGIESAIAIQGDDERALGECEVAKGAEEASPDDLIELLMGTYGKADEFNAEHVALDPADFAEFNRKGG